MVDIYFTVIVPAYNRSDVIRETLMSVANQTFTNFECIVVDDGSDDAEDLARVIDDLNDERFFCIHQDNGGGGAARNAGISLAKGLYIAFLDSDDYFDVSKLQVVFDFVERNQLTKNDVIYSLAAVDRGVAKRWVRPSRGIRADEDVAEYLFVANEFIQTSTIVIRTDFISEVRFDPVLRKGQDLDLCVRLSAHGAVFKMIEQPIVVWNDKTEVNRTSRTAGYDAPMRWLEKSEELLSRRAVSGYKANVLAYYVSSSSKFLALRYLLGGLIIGRVPLRVIFRQLLRCLISPASYRGLVNGVVGLVGRGS